MFRDVLGSAELWQGEIVGLSIAGRRVLLAHVEGGIHAYEDRCLHKGVPLSRGRLSGSELTCNAHDWCYDLSKGECLNPRGRRLRRFPVEVRKDRIFVDVDAIEVAEESA